MSFLDVGGKTWHELASDASLIHMGHNCNLLPVDPSINEAMIEAIKNDKYRNYPVPYGLDELRELVRHDVGVGNAEVLITNGSTEAIYQALCVILRPGDETIVSDPSWPHIRNFALSLGSKVIEVPIYSKAGKYKLLPDLILPRITDKTRVIAIVDPLNPIGSSYSEAEIKAICRIAEDRGIYVLHDSTYRDFAGSNHYPALRYYDKAVVTISLSKSCGFAGLRLGAVIAPPSIFQQITDHHISRLGVNLVTQLGAIAAYRTKEVWLPRMLETNRKHQKLLKECLDKIAGLEVLVYPSMGNFLAVDVTGAGVGAEDVVRRSLEAGFVLRSGAYTSQKFGDMFIRITTTVPTEYVSKFASTFPSAISRMPA